MTASAHWKSLLEERVRVSKEALCSLTQQQVHESRREMDRRARRAFENEHKGPSKFTGKQGSSHQPELLRWAVPVGLQWVSKGSTQEVTELRTERERYGGDTRMQQSVSNRARCA